MFSNEEFLPINGIVPQFLVYKSTYLCSQFILAQCYNVLIVN